MARKRFNLNRVCSSDNYQSSRNIHRDYIKNFHNIHVVEIESITKVTKVKQKCYTSCFGQLVEITEAEAIRLENYVKIIRM